MLASVDGNLTAMPVVQAHAQPPAAPPERPTWLATLARRAITAAILIPLVVALVWFGGWVAFAGAAVVLAVASGELRVMFARLSWQLVTLLSVAVGLDFLLSAMLPGVRAVLVQAGIGVAVIGAFSWLLVARPMSDRTIVEWALTLAVPFYLGWPLSLLLLLRGDEPGSATPGFWWLLLLLLTVWANDSAALLAGHYLGRGGRHKLARRVSPNKTWEGFLGGLIASICAVTAVAAVANRVLARPIALPWYHQITLSVFIALAATADDLAKSMLKRGTGVKDSGKLLHGHGGLLDRADSLLFATYVVFFYAMALGGAL